MCVLGGGGGGGKRIGEGVGGGAKKRIIASCTLSAPADKPIYEDPPHPPTSPPPNHHHHHHHPYPDPTPPTPLPSPPSTPHFLPEMWNPRLDHEIVGSAVFRRDSAWSYFEATHHGPESQVVMQRARSRRGTERKELAGRGVSPPADSKGGEQGANPLCILRHYPDEDDTDWGSREEGWWGRWGVGLGRG